MANTPFQAMKACIGKETIGTRRRNTATGHYVRALHSTDQVEGRISYEWSSPLY